MHPKYFVTKNLNKLAEANRILGFELLHIDLDLLEVQSLDVCEVVRQKAKDAFQKTGKVALVEDTGLYFESWNGLPGALIKWFLENVGASGILKMLGQEKNRAAVAKTAVGFFDGTETRIFIGETKGTIVSDLNSEGKTGFGWDVLFVPEGSDKSFAELSPQEKDALSMRKKALEKMREASGTSGF